jgi:rhodanese-related sulfurtransferase
MGGAEAVKRFLRMTLLPMLLIGAISSAWSYDADMAASYKRLFSGVSGAEAGKALHFISPEAFVAKLKKGESPVAVDIRTPAETDLFSLSLAGSLTIPTDQVFAPENLARLPTDKPVVIVCKSGARAAAVGTALRHIGFDNVYILKGGFQALAAYYGPGEAYTSAAPGGDSKE